VWASIRKLKIKRETCHEIGEERRRVKKRVVPAYTVNVYRRVEVQIHSLSFALG